MTFDNERSKQILIFAQRTLGIRAIQAYRTEALQQIAKMSLFDPLAKKRTERYFEEELNLTTVIKVDHIAEMVTRIGCTPKLTRHINTRSHY